MEWMTPTSSKTKSTSSTPATSVAPQEAKFDLFAQKFIPAWLQNINALPALHTIFSPAPAYTNFEEYAQTFLPKPLLSVSPSCQFLASIQSPRYALDVSPLGPQIPLARLEIRNYAAHFRNALIEERRALAEEFKRYNLFETPLELVRWQKDMYTLNVPGLREYVPAVFVGDSVIIRAIRLPTLQLSGPFDGIEYIGYIWAIDRLKVKCSSVLSDFRSF
jgi:hypothetical protein